ncbi:MULTISPECIES: hypothetical protein [unclassified Mycoplasma]|uniref:hypothetical protein n=1 Tax=unclassified Mycoplasma TaxID=2683645 RepID=UPI001C10F035|nr:MULTISPECIES: hypothetical protein [unclassified Mycoplasma]MBU4693230.1 hypothetical protein [Mycoplasma sp. CSL7491-lung]MCU4707018.1 hypothetical protein [Mycoplasma sp. CSL7503-lung]
MKQQTPKISNMKKFTFYTIGTIISFFVPYAMYDLITKWNDYSLIQSIIIITTIVLTTLLSMFSIFKLIKQFTLIKKWKKYQKTLENLKNSPEENSKEIEELEILINKLNEKYFRK